MNYNVFLNIQAWKPILVEPKNKQNQAFVKAHNRSSLNAYICSSLFHGWKTAISSCIIECPSTLPSADLGSEVHTRDHQSASRWRGTTDGDSLCDFRTPLTGQTHPHWQWHPHPWSLQPLKAAATFLYSDGHLSSKTPEETTCFGYTPVRYSS